jgi:hypothetical protein
MAVMKYYNELATSEGVKSYTTDTNLPTPSEIRNRWCFGLPLNKEDGTVIPDEDIHMFLIGAIRTVERKLGIFLKPTTIMCNPEERGLVQDVDFDVEEAPYDYDARAYKQYGFLQLFQRPIQRILGLKMILPNGNPIIDFMAEESRRKWVKLDKKAGQVRIVPYAGDPTIFALLGGSQTGYPFVTGMINQNLPHMFHVDYIAGYEAYKIPEDIRNAVAKMAAIDVLGIAGDAVLAGVASLSTSIDGLSESFSTTASATNATYGAHILQYQKEVDTLFDPKEGAGLRTSERGITMIGL